MILLDLTAAFATTPESELRFHRRRSPVATIVPGRAVTVRTTSRCQVNHRRAYAWSATGASLGPHTAHYVHCRLISVIESHGLLPHMYANDTQVYSFGRPAAVDALSSKISECVGAVASRMESNRLSLNCDKTEVVWCATSR